MWKPLTTAFENIVTNKKATTTYQVAISEKRSVWKSKGSYLHQIQ